jgi:hypothetical protein
MELEKKLAESFMIKPKECLEKKIAKIVTPKLYILLDFWH